MNSGGDDRLAVGVQLELHRGVIPGGGLVRADDRAVLLDVDSGDAPRVLLDVGHRVNARGRSPAAVDLKRHSLGVRVLHEHVHQVLAVHLVKFPGVVVVADGNPILLGQLAEFVQVLGCLLGLLDGVEGGHGAGHVLHAQLGQIGQVLLHEVERHMGGDCLHPGLIQGFLYVLHRDLLIPAGKFHTGIAHLPSGFDLLQQGEGAVEPEGVQLQIDGFHTLHPQSGAARLRSRRACRSWRTDRWHPGSW